MSVSFILSERLKTVKNAVDKCNCVADIGCDHGYVSISLLKDGVASKVIACDVNEGPLKAAKENISNAGLSDCIETRLGDGLHKITTDDKVDVLVIAGMGGRLMARILDEGLEVVSNCSQLVLQPQSENFLVRQWLYEHDFIIEREFMVEDMGKFYWIIDAKKGTYVGPSEEDLKMIYDEFSEYLLNQKNQVLKKYLDNQLLLCNQYLKGIEEGKGDNLKATIEKLKKALELY
ncbi:MAG: class I SAM-dependent methyltransferase [Lachnospiraceae bacterium]|nr:class I SAM-dependent methyltransferase [Lachnospiraceae bacterium]